MSNVENRLGLAKTDIKLRETEFDGVTYVCPTWEQMGEYTFELAKKIIDSGNSYDRVIAVAKGGWTWARTLIDYLDIDKISSVRFKSYHGVNEPGRPQIIQPLTDSVVGEKVLIFDEVIDSGNTLKLGLQYLKIMGAKETHTAGLCYKPCSGIKPNYYAFSTGGWVVFPHEVREFTEESIDRWGQAGLSAEIIKNRLVTIGLPSDQVDFYYSMHVGK